IESLADSQGGIHIEQVAWQVEGLSIDAFRAAWNDVIARHPVLRTGFIWQGQKQFLQAVLASVKLPMKLESTVSLDRDEVAELMRKERKRGFKLNKPPLMRLRVLANGDAHLVIWTFHHIILDGWSVSLVLRDLQERYGLHRAGEPPALPPAPSFERYIRWILQQDRGDAERYWRDELRGASATLPGVPAQHGPQPPHDSAGDECGFRLGVDRAGAIRRLTRSRGLTASAVLQGVLAAQLSGYAQTEDALFGITVSGRPSRIADVEEICGLFINTVPVRYRLQSGRGLLEQLTANQDHRRERSAFEFLSTGEIHRCCGYDATVPLFHVLLVVENFPEHEGDAGAASLQIVDQQTEGARTDYLLVLLATCREDIEIKLIFDQRRMAYTSAQRFADDLEALLQHLASDSETTVEALIGRLGAEPPEISAAVAQAGSRAGMVPRDDLEMQLLLLWRDILGTREIALDDNFFALGGHSLLAIELMAEVRKRFGRELPLAELFKQPTIAHLAMLLRDREPGPWQPVVELSGDQGQPSDGTTLFCIHPLGGGVVTYMALA
ncbi:MAG: condensation domain-containing protein, partial [Myxococcota bacterium]